MFEDEIVQFRKNFDEFKTKRLVIYGIGRKTATLVSGLDDYEIVGLMDKDPKLVGQIYYGKKLLSLAEAEKMGDVIIINSSRMFWEIIFMRISGAKIPVYFLNGEKARIEEKKVENNEYWNTSFEDLKREVDKHQVISFDFYDTLVCRKIYNPNTVFELIQKRVENVMGNARMYIQYRMQAIKELQDNYNLDQLYDKMGELAALSVEERHEIKKIEMEIEETLIRVRQKMLEIFTYARENGKKVYVISDMYFSNEFIHHLLRKNGFEIDKENVIVSSDYNASKLDGKLWKIFHEKHLKGEKALHIGDNIKADIVNPRKIGIDSFYIMSVGDMIRNSSYRVIAEKVQTMYQSIVAGIIMAEIYNDPFCLNFSRGKIRIDTFREFGFVIEGALMLTFLLYLVKVAKKNNVDEYLFFARDGYFLEQNYNYFLEAGNLKEMPEAKYLEVSRRLILAVNSMEDESLVQFMTYPYKGNYGDYLFKRFGVRAESLDERIVISLPTDQAKILAMNKKYEKKIKTNIRVENKNYKKYLSGLRISDQMAVVDVGVQGTTQHYLSKILGRKFKGYYFVMNNRKDNKYFRENVMKSCFNERKSMHNCNVYNFSFVLEAYLTAPYGMIKTINQRGERICEEAKSAQKYFNTRIEINKGVMDFIDQFLEIMKVEEYEEEVIEREFVDEIFGVMLNNNTIIGNEIKKYYFWDNGLIEERETKIFE